jgi:hypothetical protein
LPNGNNIVNVENKYAVIADYSRFKHSVRAKVEVHGGATLEEVVVPVIEFSLASSLSKIKYNVSLENNVIFKKFNVIPKVIAEIAPDCSKVVAKIRNNEYEVKKIATCKFEIYMENITVGEHDLKLVIDDKDERIIKITLKSIGIKERSDMNFED